MPIGLCFVHSFSLYKVFKLHYFSLDFLFAGSLTQVWAQVLSPNCHYEAHSLCKSARIETIKRTVIHYLERMLYI